MDSIEKAIRNAFEKGDPSERAFRERVYRSAFAALDRALQANPNVTQDMVERRRRLLSATISEIESEFIPAVPAVEPAVQPAGPPAPAPEVVAAPEPAYVEPVVAVPDPAAGSSGSAFEPVLDPGDRAPADHLDDDIEPPSHDERGLPPRRRRPWAALLAAALVLAAAGAGAWWALAPAGRDPPPPQTAAPPPPAEPRPAAGSADLGGWIVVFEPSDPTTVTAPGDSRAEVLEDDGEQFIRISAGASGSPVLFDVGQGILEQVAGRRAIFNIVAQAQEGRGTQISVDCSLGELGDCGRKRYAVGVTREEFLFELTLPAARPGAGGTIAINPDIEGSGRSVDIYAIRVSPAG